MFSRKKKSKKKEEERHENIENTGVQDPDEAREVNQEDMAGPTALTSDTPHEQVPGNFPPDMNEPPTWTTDSTTQGLTDSEDMAKPIPWTTALIEPSQESNISSGKPQAPKIENAPFPDMFDVSPDEKVPESKLVRSKSLSMSTVHEDEPLESESEEEPESATSSKSKEPIALAASDSKVTEQESGRRKTFFHDLMLTIEEPKSISEERAAKPILDQNLAERRVTLGNIHSDIQTFLNADRTSASKCLNRQVLGDDDEGMEKKTASDREGSISSVKKGCLAHPLPISFGEQSNFEDPLNRSTSWIGPEQTSSFPTRKSHIPDSAMEIYSKRHTWYSDESLSATGSNLKKIEPEWYEEEMNRQKATEAAQVQSGEIPISDDGLVTGSLVSKTQHILTPSYLTQNDTLRGFEMPEAFHQKFQQFATSADEGQKSSSRLQVDEFAEPTISLSGVERWLETAGILDHSKLTLVHTGFCFFATKPERKDRLDMDEFLIFLGKISRLRGKGIPEIINKLTTCSPPDVACFIGRTSKGVDGKSGKTGGRYLNRDN